ncbi:MAG: 2-C-methyl-D-erythritol 4-phosphate cytidylyltransferase [Saccharospirillaceae bacterium]|nr:2-C-methyl-D-erythritol 4-phosphate cytidylyltransferase [Thalassolituus sp. HI0120]MCH2040995.1 2-C-methyl-D-erythritol 4-phosphate cytidylyltransferase [Saccharospirillaceae bacterium]
MTSSTSLPHTDSPKFWPILPAAGVGSRMQADRPKQYLSLHGQFLMDHTLQVMLSYPKFEQLVLVLSPGDPYWPESTFASDSRIIQADGGSERCYSVLNGLKALEGIAASDDWVAVHDVARPCLRHSDLDALFMALENSSADNNAVCGAILASPTRDTMKRGIKQQDGTVTIDHTVEREQLWHALTPQVFRYAELKQALEYCLQNKREVTDEASALEQIQQLPLLVEGRADNIKVTRPEDLALAELFLSRR